MTTAITCKTVIAVVTFCVNVYDEFFEFGHNRVPPFVRLIKLQYIYIGNFILNEKSYTLDNAFEERRTDITLLAVSFVVEK